MNARSAAHTIARHAVSGMGAPGKLGRMGSASTRTSQRVR